jgi:hypothetical protein
MRAPSAAGSIRRLPHNFYHAHYLIKFSEFNALYRKAQVLIVKRILPTLLDYFLFKTVTNKTIVKAFFTKN